MEEHEDETSQSTGSTTEVDRNNYGEPTLWDQILKKQPEVFGIFSNYFFTIYFIIHNKTFIFT